MSGRNPDIIHAHEWQLSAVPMLYWSAPPCTLCFFLKFVCLITRQDCALSSLPGHGLFHEHAALLLQGKRHNFRGDLGKQPCARGALARVLQGQLPPGWPDQGARHPDDPQHGQQRRVQAGGVCVHWCAFKPICGAMSLLTPLRRISLNRAAPAGLPGSMFAMVDKALDERTIGEHLPRTLFHLAALWLAMSQLLTKGHATAGHNPERLCLMKARTSRAL